MIKNLERDMHGGGGLEDFTFDQNFMNNRFGNKFYNLSPDKFQMQDEFGNRVEGLGDKEVFRQNRFGN